MKIKRNPNFNIKPPKYDKIVEGDNSYYNDEEFLELCVVPKKSKFSIDKFAYKYAHRLHLIRTISTVTNAIISLCVLLRVFKVI